MGFFYFMADPIQRGGSGISVGRDANRVPVTFGVSTGDGITPVPLEVNPSTGQLQTSSSGGGGGSVTQGTTPWVDNITQVGGSNISLGQTTMANSLPVTLASNQTNVPISGTVNQGTAAAVTGGWPVIGGELADTTGTFTNATQTTSVTTSSFDGYSTVIVSINGTYDTASGVFEISDDGGTTWYAVNAARSDGSAVETSYASLTNVNRMWTLSVSGADEFRVRSTAVNTGTVNVRISVESMPTPEAASVNAYVTDGTNQVNILKSDGTAAGQNAQLVAGTGYTTGTISLSAGTQATSWYDMLNYSAVSVAILTNTTPATFTFQTAGNSAQTNIRTMPMIDSQSATSAFSTTTSSINGVFYGNRTGRYFRVNTNLAGGNTATIVITFFTNSPTFPINANVGSSTATGIAVPANAFYIAASNGTNLIGLTNAAGIGDGSTSPLTSAPTVYNGTTWDRQRSANAASNTTGTGLLGVGNLMFDGTNYQFMRNGTGLSDNTSGSWLATLKSSFNGSAYDRDRNNTTGVVIAAGATSSNAGVTTTTYNASKAVIIVNIASATAATLTVAINGITSAGYSYPILTSTALATVAVTPLRIFPGATPSANATANDMVPRALQVVTTVTGTISYGIDYELSV